MPVAESIARLDAAWYGQALGRNVVAAEPEPLAFAGNAADMARVRLTCDGSGPATVIAKIRGADAMRTALDAAMGLYAREAAFYAGYADRVPVATPACYHVGDGTTTPMLLEDLGGLRMGDQLDGIAVEDAERLVDLLADLHAAFWDLAPDDVLGSPARGPTRR